MSLKNKNIYTTEDTEGKNKKYLPQRTQRVRIRIITNRGHRGRSIKVLKDFLSNPYNFLIQFLPSESSVPSVVTLSFLFLRVFTTEDTVDTEVGNVSVLKNFFQTPFP
jgi:hypothetical protein